MEADVTSEREAMLRISVVARNALLFEPMAHPYNSLGNFKLQMRTSFAIGFAFLPLMRLGAPKTISAI